MMNHVVRRRNPLCHAGLCNSLLLLLAVVSLTGCGSTPAKLSDKGSPAAETVRMAQQLQKKGDWAGANDLFRRAVQTDPANPLARQGLAQTLEKTGYLEPAAEEYGVVAKLNPKNGEAQRDLGRVLLALERPSGARDAYLAALDSNSDDTKAMNGLAVALDNLGDHASAQKQFRAALREDPDNLTTCNNLAYSYILDGNFKEAIALLEPRIKAKQATPALRQNLALAYGLSGMDLDAERVAKIDLPPAKVKENMAYYKMRRAEMAVTSAPYAEVGTYATQALAEAEIAKLQRQFEDTGVDLKPVIAPQVAAPGGTPRFAVRMMGCAKPDDVDVFCAALAQHGAPCMVRNAK